MRKQPLIIGICLLVATLAGCRKAPSANEQVQEAYRPIYMERSAIEDVFSAAPHTIADPGKIYYKDNFIFINERGQGIHIIDNTDPSAPVNLGFINIPGNWDMAIKGNTLYADNALDLIAIDIANPTQINVVKRIENNFPASRFPDEFGVSFECVDDTKGIVVGWELTQVTNPMCYR